MKPVKWIEVRGTKNKLAKNGFYWCTWHRNKNELNHSPGYDTRQNATRAASNHSRSLKVPLEIIQVR